MTARDEERLKGIANLNGDMVAVGNVNRDMHKQIEALKDTGKDNRVKW